MRPLYKIYLVPHPVSTELLKLVCKVAFTIVSKGTKYACKYTIILFYVELMKILC